MFAVLKGLGAQHRLEPLVLSRLALDPAVTERILEYVDRTNVGTLGAIGAAFLILTVVSLLGSIEATFNHIWRVKMGRSWYRKVTDYVSVVLLTPFLLLVAVAITSSLHEQRLLRWLLDTEYIGGALLAVLRLVPFAINVLALGVLYAVMPNRRPNVRAIAIGAVAAGCAWQLVQMGYVALQIGVARYNAIYGALAQLPVTLVWIYVSWVVVLAGVELAAVVEFGPDPGTREWSRASRWGTALQVLVRAAESFRTSGGGIEPQHLAAEMQVDSHLVADVTEKLRDAHFLAAVEGAPGTYVLARDPSCIDLAMLAAVFDGATAPPVCDPRVGSILDQLDAERYAELRQHTVADLLDGKIECDRPALPH
jgi:membrane protein